MRQKPLRGAGLRGTEPFGTPRRGLTCVGDRGLQKQAAASRECVRTSVGQTGESEGLSRRPRDVEGRGSEGPARPEDPLREVQGSCAVGIASQALDITGAGMS